MQDQTFDLHEMLCYICDTVVHGVLIKNETILL